VNAQPDKEVRRRRKAPPRRAPVMIEQAQATPFLFGWGSHLTRHEREAVKERIALFAGIGLAVLVLGLLGWGLLKDNVIDPNQQAAANNVPIASVGNFTVTTGFFKNFEQFRYNQLTQQVAQAQQAATSLKKNDPQQAQIQAEISGIQQELGNLAPIALTNLLDDSTLIQRSSILGVTTSQKAIDASMFQLEKAQGGKVHLQQFIQSTGLSSDQFRMLVVGDYLRGKVAAVLAKKVNPYQLKVRASHILLPTKQKALAQRLLHEVEHGANFAALARKYSTDPGSKNHGGDLGFVARGAMVPAFDRAIFSMKVGEFRLVQSRYGWHVIKLTGHQQVKSTPAELQQAKDAALAGWIQREQAKLHIQKFVAPANLPTVPGAAAASAASNVQIPGQTVPGQTIPGQTVPGQTVPGQTVPGQTVPGQTVPNAPGVQVPAQPGAKPSVPKVGSGKNGSKP